MDSGHLSGAGQLKLQKLSWIFALMWNANLYLSQSKHNVSLFYFSYPALSLFIIVVFWLGCSLYSKNDLNFMGIKSSPSFIDRRQMVVKLMVNVIGKRSPRWKVFGVKLCFEYFLFHFHLNSTSPSLNFPNLSLQTTLWNI